MNWGNQYTNAAEHVKTHDSRVAENWCPPKLLPTKRDMEIARREAAHRLTVVYALPRAATKRCPSLDYYDNIKGCENDDLAF